MTVIDDHGRPEPPLAADETTMLLAFLDYQRATLAWKCRGLDAAGLNATTAASTMTLGGLLKHVAHVEEYWFSWRLFHRVPPPPWDNTDEGWSWRSAAQDSPEELRSLWEGAVAHARELVAEALAGEGLDMRAALPWDDGTAPTLRWILCHMIEEYARHNGHADLLRESVDGETGE